jgi:5-methylcytosine-specific restriction endonuclease McrA
MKETSEARHSRYLRHRDKERAQQAVYRAEHQAQIHAQQLEYRERNRDRTNERNRAAWPTKKERSREASRLWRSRNKERLKAYYAEWRERNRATLYAHLAAWQTQNKDKVRAYLQISQNRRRKAPGDGISRDQWLAIRSAYQFRCVYCGIRKERLTMDHVIPLSRDGVDAIENIVPACRSCNARKYTNPAPLVPSIRLLF